MGGGEVSARRRPLVLVIEDEPSIRQFLRAFLTEEGYDVEEAGDGMEGLELATRLRPDVIVCDVLMPRLDGGEFLRRYRAGPGPHAPVIIASASSKYLGVALPPDADAYAEKPFEIDQLLTLLQRFAGVGAG
jgi:two-component system response regulator MprA